MKQFAFFKITTTAAADHCERRQPNARPFIQRKQWCIPVACNPVIQRHATLRVSMLAGLVTLGLLAGPEWRHVNIDKSVGPSILVSAPEMLPASLLVAKGLEKGQERVPSLADVTSSAPLRTTAFVEQSAPKVTPLEQTQVIDARTVRSGDLTIRLAGIELPAVGETCRRLDGLAVSCHDRALSYLQLLVRGKSVTCTRAEAESNGTDEGRCRLGETDIAEQLVRQGWAKAGPKPEERMVTAELAARRQNLGIWRKETN